MVRAYSNLVTIGLAVLLSGCGDPLAAPALRSEAPHAVELGWKYFNQGDLDTALRRFEVAIRHDASYAPGYYGIAYIHSVRGELDDAIKYYRLTLERDKTNPYTFANLGYALLQRERFDEALPMLDKAIELKPDCGEAYLSYANYYAFKRDWKNAETSATKALQFGLSLDPRFRALLEENGVTIGASSPGKVDVKP